MGESKKAFAADKDVSCRTHIGGQALIEGIMMRGRYNWAVAVRQPDGGIYTEEHDLASGRKKNSWLRWPVIRGCTAFVESLALGYKALNIASEHAYDWDEEEEETERQHQRRLKKEARKQGISYEEALAQDQVLQDERRVAALSQDASDAADPTSQPRKEEGGLGWLMLVSMVIGLVLGVAVFVIAPAAISNLILGSDAMNTASWNVLDGLVRVVIFVAYIWLISLMKDIRRMFSYHGAEHKTIHCFEHGLPLTVENAQAFPTLHVRCGTAFMIMVMIVAIFVYTVLGQPINSLIDLTGVAQGPLRFVLVVLTRIVLMPFIAGFSYEITVRWAGSHPENPLVRIVLWPGMQMQRLTTKPPEDSMVECAIAAMEIVLARERSEAGLEKECASCGAVHASAAQPPSPSSAQ